MRDIHAYARSPSPYEFRHTRHSSQRVQQRGVPSTDLAVFLDYADMIEQAGGGCEEWMLSRKVLGRLKAEGFPPQQIERLSRIKAIIAGGTLVTIYKSARH